MIADEEKESDFGDCECQPGFYRSSYEECKECHVTCKTCRFGQRSDCLTCHSEQNRVLRSGQCVCGEGFYGGKAESTICLECEHPCKTCFYEKYTDLVRCLSCVEE